MTILGRGNGRGKWCEVRVAKPPNYEVQIVGIPQTEGTCSMIIKIVGMHYSFFWGTPMLLCIQETIEMGATGELQI